MTQWKKDQRKCTSCVNYAEETEDHQHSDTADDEDGDDELIPHCWVCLDGDGDCNSTSWMTSWRQWLNINSTDKAGPLRRDCSCRGLSGYAHLSCLIEYAIVNEDQWRGQQYHKLRTLWTECHACKQPYQNELSIDMTTAFLYRCDKLPTKSSIDDKLDKLAALAETLEGPRREYIDATMATIIMRMRVNNCCKVEALSAKLAALVDNISPPTQANVCNRVGDGESGIEEEEKEKLLYIKNIFNIERILAWLPKRNFNWKLILEYVILHCLTTLLGHTVGHGSYYRAFVVFVIMCFVVQHWYGELCDVGYRWVDTQLRTARIEEGKGIGNSIHTLVDKLREDETLNPKRIYVCEANAYIYLGDLAILEGKASAKEVSLEYYKKAQELLKALEERTPEEFNMTATEPATESSIPLLAKTAETRHYGVASFSSTNQKANKGKCYRESYNLYVKELGQENLETIKSGRQLALALSDSKHNMEAEILLRELIAVSKRVHGAAHRSTRESESLLRFIKERKATMKVGRKQKVQAKAA